MTNCPQCQQPVGPDQFAIGDWLPIEDARGVVTSMIREINLHCDFCGKFVAVQDHSHRIIDTRAVTDPAEIERVAQLIPSCRYGEIRRLTA